MAITYKKTIPKWYWGKAFLLASKGRKSLFKDEEECRVEVRFGNDKICVQKIREDGKGKRNIDVESLRRLAKDYLNIDDASVKTVLRYLILPEIEVERIFNSLRYRYIKAIVDYGQRSSGQYITSKCNDLFKALAQKQFRGIRKNELPAKWRKILSDNKVNCSHKIPDIDKNEKAELDFILKYLREKRGEGANFLYQELIAIKPGFHELYLDCKHNFTHAKSHEEANLMENRLVVLRRLHGNNNLRILSLKKLPAHEINQDKFLTYAACNVTEGPFVYRKFIDVPFFEALVKSKTNGCFVEFFEVYDYYGGLTKEWSKKCEKFLQYPTNRLKSEQRQ